MDSNTSLLIITKKGLLKILMTSSKILLHIKEISQSIKLINSKDIVIIKCSEVFFLFCNIIFIKIVLKITVQQNNYL